jgi:hypothetical protein
MINSDVARQQQVKGLKNYTQPYFYTAYVPCIRETHFKTACCSTAMLDRTSMK